MKKIILSLMLAFSLMPMVLFSVASASSVHEIPFGAVELAAGEKKYLDSKCIVNAKSGEFLVNYKSDNILGHKVCVLDNFGNQLCPSGNAHPITVTLMLVPGRQTSLNFSIQNEGFIDDLVNPVLKLDLGDNGCYDCTLSDGSKVSHGDCSVKEPTSGASRILASVAAVLGGLTLLF